jgi:MFS family permease
MPRWRRPTGGLWGHADFLKLWSGQSISELGSQISLLAIPLLAAIDLHASPIEFSLLEVLGFLPFVLFALPAGAWVDRLPRRPVLIVGDSARAALLALIPVLWATDVLRMWQLLAIQFLVGVFTVVFDVAYMSYLPSLVARDQLVEGNSKLQLTVSLAQVAGPSTSGALVGAITAPYAIAVDAISFAASTGFMLAMRHRESRPERSPDAPRRELWPEVREGVRWVVGHPWLRALAACTGLSNFFSSVVFAILVLYLVRSLHLSSLEVGVVFALGSCGAIAGALLVTRIQRRLGVGPTIVGAILISSSADFAFPLAPHSFPLPALILGLGGGTFANVVYNVPQVSLRQAITPERLQGRMNAAMRWIVWGTIPLGALAGGALAEAYSLRLTLWVGAAGALVAILPVALTSVRSIRTIPESDVNAIVEAAGAGGVGSPASTPLQGGEVAVPLGRQ